MEQKIIIQGRYKFGCPFPSCKPSSAFIVVSSMSSSHRSRGEGFTECVSVLCDIGFTDLTPLLSFFKVLLGFPVFGEVDGSNLLGLLNLLLVGLDLLLQLVNQVSDAVLVLLVLLLLEKQLLDASLALGDGLVDLVGHLDGAVQLLLDVTGAGLQLGGDLSSSARHGKGSLLSLLLHLRQGHLGGPGSSLLCASVILLSAELVSKSASVNHGLLGLLLAVLAGGEHVVKVGLHLVDVVLQLPLGVGEAGVVAHNVGHLLAGVDQLLLHLSLAADGG